MVWFTPKPHIRYRLRVAALTTLSLAGALLLSLAIHQLVLPVLAWFCPVLVTPFYDLGVYGFYPIQKYVSFSLRPPQASHVRWDDQCDKGYVLVSPNGGSVPSAGPMILDSKGELVWMSDAFGTSMNLELQRYQGQDLLTFWAGSKAGSMGQGSYYMLDEQYNTVRIVTAAGDGNHGDLHEFKITENDTALLTVYNKANADLSAMGRPVNGWIIDSGFQEVDIATGELLFEWRASDHFRGNDSYMTHPLAGYWESIPFDFYHLNSIDKDSQGNYLISSRHFHTVTCISPTGETLWIFGGRYSDFTDLSDGKASTFRWQHDARWFSEKDGLLTLFDNEDAGILHIDASYSKGMLIHLDVANRTAELVSTYVSLQQTRAASQGSVQELPQSGNIFIGWGASAAYTEHTRAGELLCETHFGAGHLFWWGRVKSYRAYKIDWVGKPEYPPSVKTQGGIVYVSWNGATEVAYWELQGALKDGGEEAFQQVAVIEKRGFESNFKLPSNAIFTHYRVAALDKDKQYLRYSNSAEARSSSAVYKLLAALMIMTVGGGSAIGAWYMLRQLLRRRRQFFSWDGYKYSKI